MHLLRSAEYVVSYIYTFTGSVPIAHILFRNLEDFLPSSVDGLK